jgi:hypothetical protein
VNAYDCSKYVASKGSDTEYAFGMPPVRVAAELRALADQIDKGTLLIRRVITIQRASTEDWANTRILLDVVEARKRQQPLPVEELLKDAST